MPIDRYEDDNNSGYISSGYDVGVGHSRQNVVCQIPFSPSLKTKGEIKSD